MNRTEAREVLPGPGDLKELVDNVLENRKKPTVITDAEAKEILDSIVEWMADDPDEEEEQEDEDDEPLEDD